MTLRPHTSARFLPLVLLLFGAALLAGCAEAEPEAISWYYGPGIRYNGLGSTFAWSPHESEQRPYHHHGNPEFQKLVRNMIEKALEAKGFHQAASESADFWTDYWIGRHEVEDSMVNPHGEVFEEGTLVLDLVAPKSGQLIWRGVVQGRVNDSTPPEVREKRLDAAIQQLMKVFPQK
ncbi:MAG TPA: DUF4136 domain-containing protein [Phycisphaerae bacterium]|nr:DUF4136 domain-containing protein [Phycisphaerae bacterium]